MTLFDDLQAISHMVKNNLPKMNNNEDATINVSVSPLIRALGYNTQDLDEVYPQYPILNTDAVDYAILRDDMPVMFVEAKAAGNKLQNKEWKQLFQYFNAEIGLRFGVLTNGVEYRFFTDLKADNIMDKEPFLTLDMLNLDERLVAELEGFTKAGFDPERVVAGARKRVMARLLKQEMNNPSNEIVRHFAKQLTTKRLSSDQLSYYTGLLREAWKGLVEAEIGKRLPIPDNGEDDGQKPPPPPPGKDIPVFGYYEGHRFEAELLRKSINDGLTIVGNQIRYNGKTMWLKRAAVMAIQSVEPSFEPTRTYPNGFQFWHVVDPADGKEHMIRYISGWDMTDDALRERILSS